MRLGVDHEQIHASCRIDPWFLGRIQEIVDLEEQREGARAAADGGAAAPAEGDGLLRRAARPSSPARPRRTSGAQARTRSACSPVFKRIDTCAAEFASPTAYMYSTYETAAARALRPCEAEPSDAPEDHHPRRRAEPHRPGHRVRLLLLPRLLRAVEGGLRDDHGQLQPGDRLDRLRHLRPALLRAADGRGRARDHPRRAVERHASRASSSSSAARRR